MKGGVFRPEYELECYREVAKALDGDSFRFDPNAAWSTEQAIWFGQQIEDIKNDYFEDPVFGLHAMRRTRKALTENTALHSANGKNQKRRNR